MSALTPRQRETLQLAANGLRDRDIAERLGISTRAVGHHLHGAYVRLGASNRTAAVLKAANLGLIEPVCAGCPGKDAMLLVKDGTIRELKRQIRQLNRQKELLEEDISELAPDALDDMRHVLNHAGADR